jgi:hypothetical protein
MVRQDRFPDLPVVVAGNEEQQFRPDAVDIGFHPRISESVCHTVFFELFANRLPGQAPHFSGILILNVYVFSRAIGRNIIDPVAGDPPVQGYPVITDPAAVGRDCGEIFVVVDVIDPGTGSGYIINDILLSVGRKTAVLHS